MSDGGPATGGGGNLAERLKDLLWPRTCAVHDCGAPVDRPSGYLCSRCYATLPWYDEFAKSAFAYLSPIVELVNRYKFNGATYLTDDFADALERSFRRKHVAAAVDVVVPVPLHPNRLRTRGYNQSGLLAAAFAARLGRRCDETSFARIRDTEHQSRSTGTPQSRTAHARGHRRSFNRSARLPPPPVAAPPSLICRVRLPRSRRRALRRRHRSRPRSGT